MDELNRELAEAKHATDLARGLPICDAVLVHADGTICNVSAAFQRLIFVDAVLFRDDGWRLGFPAFLSPQAVARCDERWEGLAVRSNRFRLLWWDQSADQRNLWRRKITRLVNGSRVKHGGRFNW